MRHIPNRPAICEAVREAVSKAWGSLADYPAPPYLINMPPACPYSYYPDDDEDCKMCEATGGVCCDPGDDPHACAVKEPAEYLCPHCGRPLALTGSGYFICENNKCLALWRQTEEENLKREIERAREEEDDAVL